MRPIFLLVWLSIFDPLALLAKSEVFQRERPIECELNSISQIEFKPEASTTEVSQYFPIVRPIGRVNAGTCLNFHLYEIGIDVSTRQCPAGHDCSAVICEHEFPMLNGTYQGPTLRQAHLCSKNELIYLFVGFDPMKKEFVIFPDWTTTPTRTKEFLRTNATQRIVEALHEENSMRIPPLAHLPEIRIDSRSSVAEFKNFPEKLGLQNRTDLIKLSCYADRSIAAKTWLNTKNVDVFSSEGGELWFEGANVYYRRPPVANLLCSSDQFTDEVSWKGSQTDSSSKKLGFEKLTYRIYEHDRFVKESELIVWDEAPPAFGNQKAFLYKKGTWQIRSLFQDFLKFYRITNNYPADLYFKVEPSLEDFYQLPPVIFIQDKIGRWMKYLLEVGSSPAQ